MLVDSIKVHSVRAPQFEVDAVYAHQETEVVPAARIQASREGSVAYRTSALGSGRWDGGRWDRGPWNQRGCRHNHLPDSVLEFRA
jgi:hypothetical protein